MRDMRSVLAVLAAVAVSGCFQYGSSSVFGPLAGGDQAVESPAWAFSVKAKPAQGPTPLRVTFTLDVRDAPASLPWSVDFGDRSPPAAGRGPSATLQHVYVQQGKHQAFITIGAGLNTTRGTLAVQVLPPGAPAHPGEEAEAKPVPREPPQTHRAERAGPASSSSTGSTAPPSSSSSTGPTGSPSSSSASTAPSGGKHGHDKKTGSSTTGPSSSSGPSGSSSTTSATSSSPPSTSQTGSSSTSTTTSSSPSPTGSPSPTPTGSPTPSPAGTSSSSSSAASSPTETPSPTPANAPPNASLSADPATAPAPATVTYTVAASDPDADALTWDLAVDGTTVGSGTQADLPRSIPQTYDAPGNHTAVLTVSDGLETVQRQALVVVTAAQDPAA